MKNYTNLFDAVSVAILLLLTALGYAGAMAIDAAIASGAVGLCREAPYGLPKVVAKEENSRGVLTLPPPPSEDSFGDPFASVDTEDQRRKTDDVEVQR